MTETIESVRSDDLLGLLADERRRRLLRQLADGPATTSVDDLAAALAEPEHRERLRLRLYHAHLPRLADLGVVEFDRRTGAVRYLQDERLANRLREAVAALEEPDSSP